MPFDTYTTKQLLQQAQQIELAAATQLDTRIDLIIQICSNIHELQKERGRSNIFLASKGEYYTQACLEQYQATDKAQADLWAILKQHYVGQPNIATNHHLLLSLAVVLQHFAELPSLRYQIETQSITAEQATQHYSKIIRAMIAVIYEAVDITQHEALQQSLLGLFSFVQAKEYAGQERAWGGIGFAQSHFTTELCNKLAQLKDDQDTHFTLFTNYSATHLVQAWQDTQTHATQHEVNKLRRLIANMTLQDAVANQIAEVWYELTTHRIDAFRLIEHTIIEALKHKICAYRRALKLGQPLQSHEHETLEWTSQPELVFCTSIKNLLLEQAHRIKQMDRELTEAKQALHDHKMIYQAKVILVTQLNINEQQAHKQLQQTAMQKGQTIVQIANFIVQQYG